jgi:hypothetical protein
MESHAMRVKVVLDCLDVEACAEFWCAAAAYTRLPEWEPGYLSLRPASAEAPDLLLQQVPEAKVAKNRLHLDLHPDDGPATVERLVGLGARRIGTVNDEFADSHGTYFQVLADPEGNELCVVWRDRPAPWD